MASSILSPAMRADSETTMPYMAITAASVRPPPMSSTMWPWGEPIGISAPMAAASGSGTSWAARAGLLGGVAHGALLDAGGAGGDADHHLRLDDVEAPDDLADEVAQHRL